MRHLSHRRRINNMGKIYSKVEAAKKPRKKRDEHNRYRNVIKNFRVTLLAPSDFSHSSAHRF